MNLLTENANIRKVLNYVILVCVCFYFLGHFSGELNSVKNTGIYGAIVFCAICLFKFKDDTIANFVRNFAEHKVLIILVLALYLIIFATSIFPYSGNYNSLRAAFKDLKKSIFLFMVLLFWYKDKYKEWIFYTLILAFALCVLKNLLPVFNMDKGVFHIGEAVVNRFFSSFFDILMPFILVSFFVIKNKLINFTLFVVFIMGMAADVLTGARGSWVAFALSAILMFILIIKKHKIIITKQKCICAVFLGVMAFGALAWGYQNFAILKFKFTQFNSSGRDVILKNRLPELLQSDRCIVGLGHGSYQYYRFLNDKMTDKNLEPEYFGPNGGVDNETGLVNFLHDEPAFLAAYYHYGVFAILMPILAVYIFVLGIKVFLRSVNYYALSVAMSVFSFYFVRGLFEGYGVINLFILAFLAMIFIGEKNDKYPRT